jgi:hypothetical protein
MRSKFADTVTILYLLAFACAVAYAHFAPDLFAGVSAVLLTLPWIEYFPGIGLFGAAALNALIIYLAFAGIVGWISPTGPRKARPVDRLRRDPHQPGERNGGLRFAHPSYNNFPSDLILRSAPLRASRRRRFGSSFETRPLGRSSG